MSRRDTIIVAVLINVGLLIVLFASAIKSGSETENLVLNAPQTIEKQVSFPVKDEVDQVLSQYAKTNPVVAAVPSENVLSPAALPSSPVVNSFTEDLKLSSEPAVLAPSPVVSSPILAVPSPEKEVPGIQFTEYKVKKGDVLEKIARHHHCSVQDLKKANNLSSTSLKIGQLLKIPKAPKGLIASVDTTAKALSSEAGEFKYYTIKAGDNPWTIAIKNHMKVEELLKLNNLDEEKARRLKAGDQIRVK